MDSKLSFLTSLQHAVQELEASGFLNPLPILRKIIKDCPRVPSLEIPTNDSATFVSALKLSNLLGELIKTGKGSIPQVAALALCCILPPAVGVAETSLIFSSVFTNLGNGDVFIISLLRNIESSFVKHDSSVSESNSIEQHTHASNNSILYLHLANAIMQCPSSKLLLLQPDPQQHGNLLLHSLFDVIESACTSLISRSQASTIKAFTSWLHIAKEVIKPLERVNGCDQENETNIAIVNVILPCLKRSLRIFNCCLWDNKAFGLLLDLSHTLREMCSKEERFDVTSSNLMLCAMWELPWRNKRKLQMLAVLLPRYGEKLILSQYPELPKGIMESLAYNELQSAGADIYKALLKALSEQEFCNHFTEIHLLCLKDQSKVNGFANYWLPALTKRFPSSLKILEQQTRNDLMTQIVLLQAQRREGSVSIQSMLETPDYINALCKGLTTYNLDVRIRAFDTVCTGVHQSVTTLSTETMYKILELVHGFLMDNLSVANQAARHNIIRSMSSLLAAVRDYLSIILKNSSPDINLLNAEESKAIVSFLNWLYHFLIHNLEPGNNYQRHITSLRLYQTVLQEFSTECSTTKVPLTRLTEALEKCESRLFESPSGVRAILRCVLSPIDDVRVTAADIIVSNPELLKKLPNPRDMLAEGLNLCSSHQFYTIESGAVLFAIGALCVSGFINKLFIDLIVTANKQFAILQKGLIIGALQGSPVHGILQAMMYLLQEDTICNILPMENLFSVLDIIEKVTYHLLTILNTKSSTQDFAPSFEDMDLAIESQIYEHFSTEEKSLHLTPEYQIAVNCAWLNLKVCCELASQLGTLLTKTAQDEAVVDRCGQIMISVLQKCRHKGAFEAAGVALGTFVRNVSADGSRVHHVLLDRILTTLTHRGKDAPPLSRRSAGLAVAVHRIVSMEADTNKVLLHKVVTQILDELQVEETAKDGSIQSDLVDAFSARLMHVLFTLVSDAATRHHMAQHLENIALAALKRLSSTNWGIRNAAMQLFGAVVSKLTAQRQNRKSDENLNVDLDLEQDVEEDWDIVGSGLLEDLEISRPNLLKHLVQELHKSAEELVKAPDIMRNYTSLVFHLSLLVRMTPGPPSLRTTAQATAVKHLCNSCWVLLGCSEWAVRMQAAACILALTPIVHIPQLLSHAHQDLNNAPENRRHGCLLLIAKTESKINVLLQLMPKELGLRTCQTSSITLSKAQIKPTGSYVCHQFIKFKDIKKGDFYRILRELSKYPCSKHVAKMLWTAKLAETVVLEQKGIPAGDILDKCLETESLFYIQQRVLATVYFMITNDKLIEEMLDIQLILYETLDQILISINLDCSRHRLMLVIKVLVAIKRKMTEKYIRDNMNEFHMCLVKNNELESATKIKQWIHVIGETLWVTPLISMLEENTYGDEFEWYSFELLGLYAVELMAARYVPECIEVLAALTALMQRSLQEDIADRSSVGRALATISLLSWNLHPICSFYDCRPGNIGYIVLSATGELLTDHNIDAARSVWPLSSKRDGETLNPVYCLRQMCRFGAEKLMASKMFYTYLWQQLIVNREELKQSALVDYEIESPFSHSSTGMDLETLDFIASGFKFLEEYRKHLMGKDPKFAALIPEYNIHLPGSSMQELRVITKEVVDTISIFRKQATGPLQWLPLDLQVAVRKLSLQLWIHRETLQLLGIDLRLTDLDGTSAEQRVYQLRSHLSTANELDNPEFK